MRNKKNTRCRKKAGETQRDREKITGEIKKCRLREGTLEKE